MSELPKDELVKELLGLARKSRQGAAGPWPLAWLRTDCPTLLSVVPTSLLAEDTAAHRESAIVRLLARVVEQAVIHRSQSVRAAGDLLGLSKLTDEEIEKLRQGYRKAHSKGPKTLARHGREIRLLLAARHMGMVIQSAKDNEKRWMMALVAELCDYLDNEGKKLTMLARALGSSPTSNPPSERNRVIPRDMPSIPPEWAGAHEVGRADEIPNPFGVSYKDPLEELRKRLVGPPASPVPSEATPAEVEEKWMPFPSYEPPHEDPFESLRRRVVGPPD